MECVFAYIVGCHDLEITSEPFAERKRGRERMGECVFSRVRVRERERECVCVRACVRACVWQTQTDTDRHADTDG